MAEAELIDLYYADECRVSLSPVVPYAWQFGDEDVWLPSSQGPGLNCFGLLRRDNTLRFQTRTHPITAAFIVEQLEARRAWPLLSSVTNAISGNDSFFACYRLAHSGQKLTDRNRRD